MTREKQDQSTVWYCHLTSNWIANL